MHEENMTLTEVFSPPSDKLFGTFAVVCGYSATARLLQKALDSFTREGEIARRARGGINMLLFLDPRAKILNSSLIPGLYHVAPRAEEKWNPKFKLMHAKVAMLCFSQSHSGPTEVVRLVVNTGNWTEKSASGNLELVWMTDVNLNRKHKIEDRADLSKIADFFNDLLSIYDCPGNVLEKLRWHQKKFENFPGAVRKNRARFISSLGKNHKEQYLGLLDHIVRKMKGAVQQNRLFCGSGFFESGKSGKVPEVLEQIVNRLHDAGVLCAGMDRVRKNLVINPMTCGAVKCWLDRYREDDDELDWMVYLPRDPHAEDEAGRSFLHAKYILVSKWTKGERFNQGRLYLGSGNLSRQGLLYPPGRSGREVGNVEAGVVLELEDFSYDDLRNRLAIGDQWNDSDIELKEDGEESELEGHEEVQVASPILALCQGKQEGKYEIIWSEERLACQLLGMDREIVQAIQPAMKTIELPEGDSLGERVRIECTSRQKTYVIPVFDQKGRFCRSKPARKTVGDLLGQLLGFPTQIVDEEFPDGLHDDNGDPPTPTDGVDRKKLKIQIPDDPVNREFLLGDAMELVEQIARKNQILTSGLLPDWIEHLEFTLIECFDTNKNAFPELKVNFLNVLKKEKFSPSWNSFGNDEKVENLRRRYENAIDNISMAWNIAEFSSIG